MKKHRNQLETKEIIKRIARYSQANQETGCIEWTGAIRKDGYGAFWDGQKTVPAHRALFSAVHSRSLGRYEFVCHRCDNRRCVNIDHLWLGSPKDNTRDMDEKGRRVITEKLRNVLRSKDAKGEANNGAKLSAEDVLSIRTSNLQGSVLAEMYGITRNHVYRLKRRERWSHLDAR